jgi:hypothetical protein
MLTTSTPSGFGWQLKITFPHWIYLVNVNKLVEITQEFITELQFDRLFLVESQNLFCSLAIKQNHSNIVGKRSNFRCPAKTSTLDKKQFLMLLTRPNTCLSLHGKDTNSMHDRLIFRWSISAYVMLLVVGLQQYLLLRWHFYKNCSRDNAIYRSNFRVITLLRTILYSTLLCSRK